MNIPLGNYYSVSDLQRDYREIINKAKKTKEPVLIMHDNKPEVAMIDLVTLDNLKKKAEEAEMLDTLEAIKIAKQEEKSGKLKKLSVGGLAKLAQD